MGLGRQKIVHLEMRGITKIFPGVVANDRVDFDVHEGEVHALLGENGAGKSTLMKILYGLYEPNEGEIRINGQPVRIKSPKEAIALGIGMIHQHFMLVDTLTVAENIALGLPSSRGFVTDLDRVSKRTLELAERYGLHVDPGAYIWQLSVGQRQRVEILKALYRGADLFILDEPTAVLTPQEVDEFMGTMRQMTRERHSIIFITHKLHEVIATCDRVTVLRNGRRIDSRPVAGCTKLDLARLMVGHDIVLPKITSAPQRGEMRLELQDVHALSERGSPALRGVSLQVQAGEIVGIAGVSGNGQSELAEVITGLRKVTRGKILVNGQDTTGKLPGELLQIGMAYIPEERMRDGIISDFTVSENIILRNHNQTPYARHGFLLHRIIREVADRLIRMFDIRTPSPTTPAGNLSGGNIQKVVLVRELSRAPKVLIAAQPTRGVDIGAIEFIHKNLLEQRAAGAAILLISEDLDEILSLSDRVAVMYEGQIMAVLENKDAERGLVGLLMAGVRPE
ncbi:MAG: heme ABC transporter ATP-binding protein [Anaerolineae bacterium]|nr:MAG: heme ABC transporter ATP-binding protein [Anaerolineae bacterium]